MQDLALRAAGVLAILVAVAHGVIGERQVFSRVTIAPPRVRKLLRMVWQASSIGWIALGALLIVAPALGSSAARRWIAAVSVPVFGYAAIGNATATRGRHVGWLLMCGVVVLTLIGL